MPKIPAKKFTKTALVPVENSGTVPATILTPPGRTHQNSENLSRSPPRDRPISRSYKNKYVNAGRESPPITVVANWSSEDSKVTVYDVHCLNEDAASGNQYAPASDKPVIIIYRPLNEQVMVGSYTTSNGVKSYLRFQCDGDTLDWTRSLINQMRNAFNSNLPEPRSSPLGDIVVFANIRNKIWLNGNAIVRTENEDFSGLQNLHIQSLHVRPVLWYNIESSEYGVKFELISVKSVDDYSSPSPAPNQLADPVLRDYFDANLFNDAEEEIVPQCKQLGTDEDDKELLKKLEQLEKINNAKRLLEPPPKMKRSSYYRRESIA